MAGLLNSNPNAQAAPQAGAMQGASEPTNQILQAIQDGIEQKVKPEDRKNFNSMVVAGMSVMFSESSGKRIMEKLKASQNVVADVSQGISNIIALVFNDVTANMPDGQKQQIMVAAMPASIVLMCQALDTYEKITGTKVDDQTAAACTSATSKAMMAKFELTPDKVKQAVASKGRQGDPGTQPAPVDPAAPPMQGA